MIVARQLLLIAIVVFAVSTALAEQTTKNRTTTGAVAAKPSAEKPNIVLIIADDCTFSDLGCYGGQAATPNLDRLCRDGMRFDRCFQAAPMCSPTRHCLYTGLYPVRSGAYPNHTRVYEGTRSVAHYLQKLGYRTALSGKSHINPRESFPFEYSKDGNETKGSNPDFTVLDSLFTESIKADKPFAAFLCSNEPHTPYTEGDASRYAVDELTLPPHFVDTPITRSTFAKYLAEITYFDSQVGRLLDLLDKHHIADDTLVVVLSEQGSSFPFAKWTCYDAGVRSGMVARWPGHVPAGTVSEAIVEYADITPTFVEVAGGDAPQHIDGKPLDGRSFLAVLSGKATSHKQYTYSLQTTRGIINGSDHYGVRSVRGDRFRLVHNLSPEEKFQNAVFRTDWWQEWTDAAAAGNAHAKQTTERYSIRPAFELFDCEADPWNLTNLAEAPEYAAVKSELQERLAAWMTQQGDEGVATEMRAKERQGRRGKSKAKPGKKKAP